MFKKDNENIDIPPFMILHGNYDQLTSYTDAKEFYNILKDYRYKYLKKEKDLFIQLKGAHHGAGYIRSPRSANIALGIATFMNNCFEVNMLSSHL